jgi:acetyl/propionyl-CoA carboxylase alpha subunit
MFAKLMFVAADRTHALARMRRALAETQIAGLQTTLAFHLWLLEQANFTDNTGAGLSTDLIARAFDPAPALAASALRAAELVSIALRGDHGRLAPPRESLDGATTNEDGWWSSGVREALENML